MSKGLTLKQERFCSEYLQDGNASRAARAAGYSEKTARVTGPENLQKPAIQQRLAELTKDSPTLEQLTPDVIAARLWDLAEDTKQQGGTRARCLEILAKSKGMLRDVQETRETPAYEVIRDHFNKLVQSFEDSGIENPEQVAKDYLKREGVEVEKIVAFPVKKND